MPRNCDRGMSRIPPGASNLILTRSALPPSLVVDGMPSSIIPWKSTRGNLPSTLTFPPSVSRPPSILPPIRHQSSRWFPAPSINSPRLPALPPSFLPSPRHQIEEPLQMPPSRGYPGSPWPRPSASLHQYCREDALSWEIPLPAPTPPRVSAWGIGSLRLCL